MPDMHLLLVCKKMQQGANKTERYVMNKRNKEVVHA